MVLTVDQLSVFVITCDAACHGGADGRRNSLVDEGNKSA